MFAHRTTGDHRKATTPAHWILTLPLVCTAILLTGVTGPPSAVAEQAPVGLGTAADFGVLAASTVTNTGPTTIDTDLGLSPGTSVTGFPPGQVDGTVHTADGVASQAQTDLAAAYDDAAARPTTDTIPAELGGTTVTPGVYDSTSGAFEITGTLTLDAQGDPNALFIFKTTSTLITASASTVDLVNDAWSTNVFWTVGSSATLGTDSTLRGNVLAMASITLTTGTTLDGRALARTGAVTLDSTTITRPADLPLPIINTTTTLTSSLNPAEVDQPITFTATVTAESGAAIPTGEVTFTDKRAVIGTGTLDGNGEATFTTSTLTANRHSIIATYSGADGFLGSASRTLSQLVIGTL